MNRAFDNNLPVIITEHATRTHVILRRLWLGGLLSLGGGGSFDRGGSSGGSGGECLGVVESGADWSGLLEDVVGLEGDGNERGVTVGERVRNRGEGGIAGLQRDGRQELHTEREPLDDLLVGDLEGLGVVDEAALVGVDHGQTIVEGLEVELLEEGGLGVADLLTFVDQVEVVDDLNLTLLNTGGNVECLQESSLSGLQTGSSGLDDDIARRDGSGLGLSLDLELVATSRASHRERERERERDNEVNIGI
jgi:hypothetical protein